MLERICIVTHQHLCRNPRVLKESIALASFGYQVTILTSIYDNSLLEEDRKLLAKTGVHYNFFNNLIETNLLSLKNRMFNKLGRWLNKLGLENKWALGYAPRNCLKQALKLNADLYICHQELPTFIGTKLIKLGRKVAFDIEDWYTQDLLPKDQAYRPQRLLEKSEQTALELGACIYTTSVTMARGLATNYKTAEPQVIGNTFDYFTNPYKVDLTTTRIKLIWISQTIGPGRGLEKIISALNEVKAKSYELFLRGAVNDGYKSALEKLLTNSQHQIHFLPLVSNQEIQSDLCNYHIGLALEANYPLNKDLTISNKIFHYLSVGVPTISSSTQGQLSLKDYFEKGIYYFNTVEELVKLLEDINISNLIDDNRYIQKVYKDKFDWSLEREKLRSIISNSIK